MCVTGGGVMKFVDVVRSEVPNSGSSSPASSTFTINLWRLGDDNMMWEKDFVMEADELWSLQRYGANLLRVAPESPLVSIEEPNNVYCVLSSDIFEGDKIWIIMVDILNKTMRSSFEYSKPDSFSDDGSNMASRNLSCNEPVLVSSPIT